MLYREHQQRLRAQKVADETCAAMKEREANAMSHGYEMSNEAGRQKLGYNQKRPGELDVSGSVYEADSEP